MAVNVEPSHDLTPIEIDALEDRLYKYNSRATGRFDAKGLSFIVRNDMGKLIAAVAGYSWSGASEIKQLWVDEIYRGQGFARKLLEAFIAEALARGVHRIWVASYDFQAPKMYEKFGFEIMAAFEGWPEGHVNMILCKTLSSAAKYDNKLKPTEIEPGPRCCPKRCTRPKNWSRRVHSCQTRITVGGGFMQMKSGIENDNANRSAK